MIKSWHIWDFPNNLYVLLKKDIHNKFFNEMFKKFGGKRPYARFLGISQGGVKHYWRRYTKKKEKRFIQYIPLWVLKKSCRTNKLKREIENGIEKIRVKGGNPVKLNLLIKESPALYRIIAHLIGDGSAGKMKVPYYSNTCKKLRKKFKKDLQIFGNIKTYERTPNTTTCIMFSKPITDILMYIFKIEFIRPSKLPKEIFSAPKECKCAFLQALFDDEGSISTCLALHMKNKNLINEIKNLMESLEIKMNGPYEESKENMFTLQIKPRELYLYKTKIGFAHPQKAKRLEFALKIREMNKIQRTRPLKWTRNKIINLLNIKPRTTIELSNKILLTVGGLYHHLTFLKNSGKIKKDGYKNKVLWKVP